MTLDILSYNHLNHLFDSGVNYAVFRSLPNRFGLMALYSKSQTLSAALHLGIRAALYLGVKGAEKALPNYQIEPLPLTSYRTSYPQLVKTALRTSFVAGTIYFRFSPKVFFISNALSWLVASTIEKKLSPQESPGNEEEIQSAKEAKANRQLSLVVRTLGELAILALLRGHSLYTLSPAQRFAMLARIKVMGSIGSGIYQLFYQAIFLDWNYANPDANVNREKVEYLFNGFYTTLSAPAEIIRMLTGNEVLINKTRGLSCGLTKASIPETVLTVLTSE